MKRFNKTEELAKEIDQFVYDLNPYGYRDSYDSRNKGLQSVLSNLISGKVNTLTQWFQNVIAEGEPKESMKKAIQLLNQLKLYDIENRLFISVMNYEENLDKLSDFPHIRRGEFVIVSQFAVGDKNEFEEYTAYLTVTHKICKNWNMNVKELFDAAIENSKVLYPGELKELNFYTEKEKNNNELFLKPDSTAVPETFVLTNKAHFNGAGVLFYQPELLDTLAAKLNTNNLALIPTGSNEIYIIAMEAGDDVANLANLTELKEAVDAALAVNTISHCVMIYQVDNHIVKEYNGEEFSLNVTEEINAGRDMSDEDAAYSINNR